MQIGLLLTFFLPFFPYGCEPKQAVEAPMVDSISTAVDSLQLDSRKLTQSVEPSDTSKTAVFENVADNKGQTKESDDDNDLSAKIAQK